MPHSAYPTHPSQTRPHPLLPPPPHSPNRPSLPPLPNPHPHHRRPLAARVRLRAELHRVADQGAQEETCECGDGGGFRGGARGVGEESGERWNVGGWEVEEESRAEGEGEEGFREAVGGGQGGGAAGEGRCGDFGYFARGVFAWFDGEL